MPRPWLNEGLFVAPRAHLSVRKPMAMQISTPQAASGRLMLLAAPYDLHSDTLSRVQTTSKKRTADNPHVEGTYLISSLKENQTVPVSVWVEEVSQANLQAAMGQLTEAFDQNYFEIEWQIDDVVETWYCSASDYEIDTQQAFLHAKMALVSAQVVRQPRIGVRRLR